MRLLVAGSRFRTRALYRWLRRMSSGMVEYFPDTHKAAAALKSESGRFDYVLLEENEENRADREIVRRLRKKNARVGIAFLASCPSEERGKVRETPKLMGLFEKSNKGSRLLSCQLSGSTISAKAVDRDRPATITYEYRADCPRKKAGNE